MHALQMHALQMHALQVQCIAVALRIVLFKSSKMGGLLFTAPTNKWSQNLVTKL